MTQSHDILVVAGNTIRFCAQKTALDQRTLAGVNVAINSYIKIFSIQAFVITRFFIILAHAITSLPLLKKHNETTQNERIGHCMV